MDKDPEFKKPAWVKTGDYAKRTCEWFELEPSRGQEDDRPIWGDYCRVTFEDPEMGSIESVKEYLYSIGWVPDDWNFKKGDRGKLVKTTPKLTSSSLSLLGTDGLLIDEFFTVRSRHSILNTWVNENVTPEGRIHGDSFVIGTPTGRARHNIIANIPSADAIYGKEIRRLFTVVDGYKMVGADSASNQNRGLCHYLGNDDYTKGVIESDIHTVNLRVLTKILGDLGPDGRRKAKAFFYALIFGGGDAKLGLILTGKRDAQTGRRVRDLFLKGIPGFDKLVNKLNALFDHTSEKGKYAYIIGLDGRPVYVDGRHKALNYLLQSCEKITCSLAVTQAMEELDRKGFDYQPLIVYHDEMEIMVREDQAEEAAEICQRAFRDAPKELGVMIMDGDAKIGYDWYDVH